MEQTYDVTVTIEVKGKEVYHNTSEYIGTNKQTVLAIENEMIEMAKRLNAKS